MFFVFFFLFNFCYSNHRLDRRVWIVWNEISGLKFSFCSAGMWTKPSAGSKRKSSSWPLTISDVTWPAFRLCFANMRGLRETWLLWRIRSGSVFIRSNHKSGFLHMHICRRLCLTALCVCSGEHSGWRSGASAANSSPECLSDPPQARRAHYQLGADPDSGC